MASIKISKASVDAVVCPPEKKREWYFDTELKGFAVVAYATGKKVFFASYRKPGQKNQSRPKIGDYGVITPEEARRRAKQILGEAASGIDPMDERRAVRAAQSFKEISEAFMTSHVEKKRKPGTLADYRSLLDNRILPALGHKQVIDVKRTDVAALHEAMHDVPYLANRALALISSIWNWAAYQEQVDEAANPARRIERYAEESREHFLTSEECSRLEAAMIQATTVGLPWDVKDPEAKRLPNPSKRFTLIDEYAVAALRLLFFTGARKNEIVKLEWDHVDLERNIIFLPDAKSKTGKKPIFINEPARAVLDSIKKIEKNPYVICGANPKEPRSDLKKPWDKILKAAGLSGVRIHDLRHTFASYGVGRGLGLPILGGLMGHKNSSTTARYAHLAPSPVREGNELIGSSIAVAMNREQKVNGS